MSKHTAPAPELFDTIEYLPLFAGLPITVQDQAPAAERPDPSGPVSTWDWAGRLDEPGTWYKQDQRQATEIDALWLRSSQPADRTHAAYAKFYRRQLIARGFDPFPATYDAGGNCYLCGEGGRCPGWHYSQEATR